MVSVDLCARPAPAWQAHCPVPDLTEAAAIRTTVALAATGLSDREIARALDCSIRTVTRRFSGAMRHYGARSRFHLGFVVASVDEPVTTGAPGAVEAAG